MKTHTRRPAALLLLVAALALSLLPAVACGGSTPVAREEDPEDTTGDEEEVEPSACVEEGALLVSGLPPEFPAAEDPRRCDELASPPPVPLPTTASCRALQGEERSACTERVRTRGRMARPLAEARAAVTAANWPVAVAGLEALLQLVVDEPDVLAELGWTRFRAHQWCVDTQDIQQLEYQLDSVGEDEAPDPVALLCTRQASLHQAVEELEAGVNAAPSLELRATWEYQRAYVSDALGQQEDAMLAVRRSLCAHDDQAARELLSGLLWSDATRAGPSAPADAVRLYREAILVAPTPEKQAYLDAVLAAMNGGFAIEAPPPLAHHEFHPDIDALCRSLVLSEMSEPVNPAELPDDLCETGDWEEVALARGDDFEVQFRVAVLTVRNPELYDGFQATFYLVARSARGLNVLLFLGLEHGDSRMHNAFVGSVSTNIRFDLPEAPLVVSWDAGEAEAFDCDWQSTASTQTALCALVAGEPRCFAWADLGPTEFTSDSMLPTIQESLGNCEDWSYTPQQHDPSAFRPNFDLTITDQELVATRSDGALVCLPLRETLSPLRQPAAGQ